jgi:hypothetical protein
MNPIVQLEAHIRTCLEYINRLRIENERMHQNTEKIQHETIVQKDENGCSETRKEQIIEQLSSLVTRLESLNIDTIMNDQ